MEKDAFIHTTKKWLQRHQDMDFVQKQKNNLMPLYKNI